MQKKPLQSEADARGVSYAGTDSQSAHETLQYFEGIFARGLPNLQASCLALLKIHRRKLYESSYSSFANYLKNRWNISRSRGYQLLAYAKVLEMSTMVDTTPPANERQSRTSSSKKLKIKNVKQIPFNNRWGRLKTSLIKQFGICPMEKRREFVMCLKQLITQFEAIIRKLTLAPETADLGPPLNLNQPK